MEDDPFKNLFGNVSDPQLEELREGGTDIDDEDEGEVSLDVAGEAEAISRVMQKLPEALNTKRGRRQTRSKPIHEDFVGLMTSSESEDFDDDRDEDYVADPRELRKAKQGSSAPFDGDSSSPSMPHDAYEITKNFLEGNISFSDFAEKMDVKGDADGDNSEDEDSPDDVGESSTPVNESPKAGPSRGPKIRRFKKLPRDLQGSLGQASLHLAAGRLDEAIEKCMEVIRIAPDAADAYKTLGTIFMQQGDDLKALQVSMIGVYLRPNDAHEWHRLASWSLDLGNREQALLCFKRAVKAEPENAEFYLEIVTLASELGNHRDCFRYGTSVIPRFAENQAQMCIQLSRTIAQIQYKYGKPTKGAEVLELAFRRFPDAISSEDVHMLLEIQIEAKLYTKALKVLISHCGIEVEPELDMDAEQWDLKDSVSVKMVDLPLDILSKCIVCVAHLGGVHLILDSVEPIIKGDLEVTGDLVFDIAEAFLQNGATARSRQLCELLLKTEKFNIAGVWWLLAQNLQNYPEEENQCIEAYRKVLEMAPDHIDARLMFSAFLEKTGSKSEAIEVLKGNNDLKLLKKRFELAQEKSNMDEFCETLFLLLSSATVYLPEELKLPMLSDWAQMKGRIEFVKNELAKRGIPNDFPTYRPNRVEFHGHIRDALRYLLKENKMDLYLDICCRAAIIWCLHDTLQDSHTLHLYTLVGAMRLGLDDVSYQAFRLLCRTYPLCTRLWNLFGIFISRSLLVRHNKFILRLLRANPDSVVLCLLNGHNALTLGSHRHALAEYFFLLERDDCPSDVTPLIHLCICIAYLQLALQKFCVNRYSLLCHAVAFCKEYVRLRGDCQETLYNVGRFAHQSGLLNIALHFYQKALKADPVPSADGMLDLSMEIAYNISRIYLHAGNVHLARYYVHKYMVI